jgi:hypothetical protein
MDEINTERAVETPLHTFGLEKLVSRMPKGKQ